MGSSGLAAIKAVICCMAVRWCNTLSSMPRLNMNPCAELLCGLILSSDVAGRLLKTQAIFTSAMASLALINPPMGYVELFVFRTREALSASWVEQPSNKPQGR